LPVTITNNDPKGFCELTPDRKRIAVYFHYNPSINAALKEMGGTFKPDEETPHWTVPLTLDAARELRQIFASGLELGAAVRSWARIEVRTEKTLHSLVVANDADLKVLPKRYPLIAKLIKGDPIPGYPKTHIFGQQRRDRSYQRADIAMMAQANAINANQPGTGKTIECLGAIIEGGYIDGPNLISAPIRSLENVWRKEIETWLPGIPVFTSEDSAKRKREVAAGLALAREGKPCFVLVNSDMLRVKKWKGKIDPTTGKQIEAEPTKKTNLACKTHEAPKDGQSNNLYVWGNDLMRDICAVDWQTFTVDEFHQEGLNNPLTLFTIGSGLVKADRHWRMSGTPMGGKPINLFPVLRSVEPARFSNKGKWVDRWLESSSNGYGNVISGIKDGLEEDFYNSHARHMVRRLKHEALPGIPRKQIVEVTCKMTKRQKAQYIAFENDAEIEIQSVIKGDDPAQVVGTCILAQFTRLKQFANAYCVANEKGEIVPTEESGKLAQLEEKLDELGIRKLMPEPNARAIISSESKRMAKMVHAWLEAKGIDAGLLTGDTKPADSQQAIQWFQEGDDGLPYVLVMSTQTGGVSLNLERAGSIHILDEMWNPDRQEQLEDRGDRGTRTTPLICYYYRTEETVQEYIAKVGAGKKITNSNVLDVYRQMRRAGFGN
jgi:SNF2 family DNA or RNA helicase